jgi:Type VIII secretion system (T8SS), CsgF protein
MSNKNKKILAIGALMVPFVALSAPLNDFTFKSPAFNGNGYGTYVLTIENEQYSRQQAINQAVQAAAQQALSNAANTPINQFLTNLESRIYAQISQNTASAMFSSSSPSSCVSSSACTFQFDPTTSISWYWSGSNIVMQVVQPSGTSNVTIPTGSFNMTGH